MKLLHKFEMKFRRIGRISQAQLSKISVKDVDSMNVAYATVKDRGKGKRTSKDFVTQARNVAPARTLRNSTKETFMYDGSFHEAVSPVLLLAQFFAIMPVKGVSAKHPSQLSFSWTNFRTWYSVVYLVWNTVCLALTMYKLCSEKITFDAIGGLFFIASGLMFSFSAINLARKWPELMRKWHETESQLPAYETQADKRRMAYKIKMVTIVALMLSLGEHISCILATISYAQICPLTGDPFKDFFLYTADKWFYVFPYTTWLGALDKFFNVLSTFGWTYIDVLVIIVSIGLSSKFRQLNDNLYKFKGRQMPEGFWSERRIQYRSLCILCEQIDNAISLITMVSYSSNLYAICVQLLKSMNKRLSITHGVYFYYSLFFLFGRAIAVSLYTADINDESKKPLHVLRCVPRESWCAEVKRFSEEINSDFVALSGMKFFHLTRQLILSVAGTIVTYELVLIQFYDVVEVKTCGK